MDKNNNKAKYSLNTYTVDQKHVKPFTLPQWIFTVTLWGTYGLLLTDDKNNLRDISNFFRITQLISGGVKMEHETSPLCYGVSVFTPVLVMVVTDRRLWEIHYFFFILFHTVWIFCPEQASYLETWEQRTKKERNQRQLLPQQFQEAEGRWTHFKKSRRKEEMRKRWKVHRVIRKKWQKHFL